MIRVEMCKREVVPNTPGGNGLIVREGRTEAQEYAEQCGHPTDALETHRRQRAREKEFEEKHPELVSPFVADRYGDPLKRR